MVIDLSHFKDVAVDTNQHLMTVRGGVLMKELQIALSEKNQFTSKAEVPLTFGPITNRTQLLQMAALLV